MNKLLKKYYYTYNPSANNTEEKRNYYIDNLKFTLMILVVLGHFAIKLTALAPIKSLLYFIYIFHMPCFIFVSGYLAKHMNKGGKLRIDKILNILWLYVIFKLANSFITYSFTGELDFNFLNDTSAPWYLIALCIWYILVPVIERIKPFYMIAASVLIGLGVGYLSYIRSVLSLSRVFVFLPFFVIGFCLSEKKLYKFLNKRIRLSALIYLTSLFIFLLVFKNELEPFSDIIYGGNSYADSLKELAPYGVLIRFTWYILAFFTSAAFMLLVPRCKVFFTSLGGRTLQVYMSHIWCRNILLYLGFFEIIESSSPWMAGLTLFGSIGLTFLLSNRLLKRVFDFISGKKLIDRLIKN